jgi:hypothetical protein
MRGRTICLGLLLLAAWPGAARAQQFSFGFATGGHHHHGHHHGHHHRHGGWYGFEIYQPRYVYPPPIVYAPPPVTYVYPAPAVQVVQPASPAFTQIQPQSAEPSSLAMSQGSTSSAARLNALPAQARSSVVLRNPAANAGAVAFRVQDQVDAELGPGTTRTWSDRASLTVEFDRGGDFGATRKILRPGAYDFVVTEEGWDLVATVSPAASSRAASLQKNALPAQR